MIAFSSLDESQRRMWRRSLILSAAMAVITAGIVAAALAATVGGGQLFTITDDETIPAQKAQLLLEPDNEGLKVAIQEADHANRIRYATRVQFVSISVWVLSISLAVAGVCMGVAMWMGGHVPAPVRSLRDPAGPGRDANFATAGLVALSGALLLAAVAVMLLASWVETPAPPGPGKTLDVRWPRFRGAGGMGWTDETLSMQFDIPAGEGLVWSSPIFLPGNSSPVLWGNHIFLTGATASQQAIFAYGAGEGNLLWTTSVPHRAKPGEEELEIMEDTGYAAATGCTDGERFFALFASGDLVAVDFSGKVLWETPLGIPHNQYGHASSLLIAEGKLIVLFDQTSGEDEEGDEESRSKLLALDVKTGETSWEASRSVPDSWGTPILIETPKGKQLITAANPWVISYDPKTGKELWRADALYGDVAPSPVYANGMVFVTQEGASTVAIHANGTGDVTETHVVWTNEEETAPDITSPLATGPLPGSPGGYLFLLTTSGELSCLDAQTGEAIWTHHFNNREFNASPMMLGPSTPDGVRPILLLDREGLATLFEPGPAYKELAKAAVGQSCDASPALGAGHLFLRSKSHLLCIEARAPQETPKNESENESKNGPDSETTTVEPTDETSGEN